MGQFDVNFAMCTVHGDNIYNTTLFTNIPSYPKLNHHKPPPTKPIFSLDSWFGFMETL